MDVYNSVSALVDPKVPAYLMSTVKEADAKAAYSALVDFAGVVKANPISASSAASRLAQRRRLHRCGLQQALRRRLPFHQGHRLDGLPVPEARPRAVAPGGYEGDRQDDRDG